MKRYLVLAETEDVGYFVEIHKTYETGLNRSMLFFDLAFDPPTDRDRMRLEFKPIGSYEINDQF